MSQLKCGLLATNLIEVLRRFGPRRLAGLKVGQSGAGARSGAPLVLGRGGLGERFWRRTLPRNARRPGFDHPQQFVGTHVQRQRQMPEQFRKGMVFKRFIVAQHALTQANRLRHLGLRQTRLLAKRSKPCPKALGAQIADFWHVVVFSFMAPILPRDISKSQK
jgi:hypothetical protein